MARSLVVRLARRTRGHALLGVFLRVLGLELNGVAVKLHGAGVLRCLVPVRPCGVRIVGSLSLAFRLVLMLQRTRLALPGPPLSRPAFRGQFWVGHTC